MSLPDLETRMPLELIFAVLSRKRPSPTQKAKALADLEHWSKVFPSLSTADVLISAIGKRQGDGSMASQIQLSGTYCELTRAYTAIGYKIYIDNPYNRDKPELHPEREDLKHDNADSEDGDE